MRGLRTNGPDAWPSGRALLVASSLLAASGVTSYAGNVLIDTRFADRPYPRDLLFELLPTFYPAHYLTEALIIASLGTLMVYVVRHARHELADGLAVFGMMYLLRSMLMVLTPLANSFDGPGHYGLFPVDQLGMFPSGHAGASLLCVMLIDAGRAPGLKRTALSLMAIQWTALLLSHGHYSIDLAGGALLGYFVAREWGDGRLFSSLKVLMRRR